MFENFFFRQLCLLLIRNSGRKLFVLHISREMLLLLLFFCLLVGFCCVLFFVLFFTVKCSVKYALKSEVVFIALVTAGR